ncbi:MAG: hypothetical protein J6Z45_02875 [Oscillospiraceae bacterium]|nr:hypothetical protein [Oscillospiraceae bacterium]
MKSLFKRVLATATGSVLLVSQLAATGININAADDASGTVLNKEWLTDVPVDTKTFPLPGIDELPVVIEGEETEAEAIQWGESIWNDQFESAINTIVGDKDFVEKTFFGKKARDIVVRNLARTTYFTEAEAEELTNGVSVADVKVSSGKATAEISIDGVNDRIGAVAEDALTRRGIEFVNADGAPVVIDWSKFPLYGSGTVEVDYSKFDKTATYNVTFTDGEKDYDGYDEFAQYVADKFNAAVDFIADEAAKQNAPKLASDIQKYRGRFDTLKAETEAVIDAVEAISFTSTDPAEAYDTYKGKFEDAVKNNGALTKRFADRAAAEFYRIPKNLDAILKGERGTAWIQYAIDAAKKFANDKVSVDLKATDFAEIVDEGYDYEITVPNGFSADVEFKLADDKNADVFDAIEMAYGDQWAAEGYELVSVTSHKEVTLNAETDRLVDSEKLFYDVVRIIDEVLLKKVEEETTESTTESTTSSETTTESTTSSETTTESTTSSTEESTTESTTSSTEESTTESTTSSTEESTTESTTSSTEESTTESSTESEPVETTTTTEGTDVYGEEGLYELAFNAEGVADELVYWSEETTEFDFDNLSVKMVLSITSEDGSSTSKDIDVTAAFEPKQKSPQDFDFVGFANYNIQIALTDVGAIRSALEAEIEDAKKDEVIEKLLKTYKVEEGRLADTKGQIPVILVLRGDFDLDNHVTAFDANAALLFSNLVTAENTLQEIMDQTDPRKFGLADLQSFIKYSHYAGDVTGDGILHPFDTTLIQRYFNLKDVAEIDDTDWDRDVVKKTTTVIERLHSEPLAYEF